MLEPVELVVERRCHFKRKPKDPETGKKRVGCARCGKAKAHRDHFGAPESLNLFASSGGMVYRTTKQRWADVFVDLLDRSGLDRGLGRVTVEGVCTFPDRQRRDQGNYRFILEKALGDALTAGGWLEDDDWTRYEFGGLAQEYEKGASRTRLLLFPWPAEPLLAPEG